METDEPDERDGSGLFGPTGSDPVEPSVPGPAAEATDGEADGAEAAQGAQGSQGGGRDGEPLRAEPPEPKNPDRPRHRLLKGLLIGAVFFSALLAVLAGWNKLVAAPGFCSTCHTMGNATSSALASVHSKVPCLACHERPGLTGALAYVPTLARETLAQLTGFHGLATGALSSGACTNCHSDLAAHGHPSKSSDCLSCHGDVAHPQTVMHAALTKVTYPHPTDWVQIHGSQVVAQPSSCNTCHQSSFCEACHFKTVYPHPAGWLTQHGLSEEKNGISSCNLCHPESFCVGCHGTQIPHQSNWLQLHWQALQGQSAQPCYTCHPTTDCTNCHAEHAVHNQQTIYQTPPYVAVPGG